MRMHPRSIAVLVFLLMGVPEVVSAQVGAVAGRLTDAQTQTPLSGAHVRALGPGSGEALSGDDGRFRIANLVPGEYTVVVSLLGYEEVRREGVRVTAAQTTTVDLALNVSAFQLNPVVVSASRRQEKALQAPATVEVVPKVQIQERPTVTPVEHLKSISGVDIIQSGLQSTNVVARGFNNIFSGSLHTLTDNRIASIPSLRVNFMHFIPANNDDIERMEVVLGPGSALYGPNTANGVLHIMTSSPLDEQGSVVSLATGMRGTQGEQLQRDCVVGTDWCGSEWPDGIADRAALVGTFRTAHLIGEDLGVKLSGQYFQGAEWIHVDPVEETARFTLITTPGVDADTVLVGRRDFDLSRWSFEGRADWRVMEDARTSFTVGHTNIVNAVELTGLGAGQARGWSNTFYQGRFDRDRLFAQAYLNTSDAGETYLLRSGDRIVDNSRMFVTQVQHGTGLAEGRVDLTYGLDFLRTMPATGGTIHGANEDDDNVTEFGGYLQTELGVTDRLDFVFAGRMDWHSHVEHPVFSPRAALVFSATQAHTFRATYNRAFSTPSTLNLFLDLDGGAAPFPLGFLGYRVRAQGTRDIGFSFMDSGELYGVLSPFANGAFSGAFANPDNHVYLSPSTDDYWTLGLGALYARQGITQAEAELLAGTAPAEGSIAPYLFDLNTQTLAPASAGIPDIPGIEESNTETFEAGYKGILGERVLVAADAWLERRNNFVSPLTPVTPLIVLDSADIADFIKGEGLVSDTRAEQIAEGMSGLPVAVATSPQINAEGSDILATYINFGDIDLYGADLSATVLLSEEWQVGLGGSWVSDDYFIEEGRLIALNAPDLKGTGRVAYRGARNGINGEVRARYTSEFPVNSAPFAATQCIAEIEDAGTLPSGSISEPCIQPYVIVDLNLGYDLPWVSGASVQMVMNNVLGTQYRSFVGVPALGRFTLVRLRYEF